MNTAPVSTQIPALGEVCPQDVYLPEVIVIARQERASMRPNLNRVLRPDVLAVWDSWQRSGVPAEKIGLRTFNGLINVTTEEVLKHLAKYRQSALVTIVTRRHANSPSPAKGATMNNMPEKNQDAPPLFFDPTAIYPAEVIEAAKEQEQSSGRRDLSGVLTDEVLAIWHRWNAENGISMGKIAEKRHNGLIDVHQTQVSIYLGKYRKRLADGALGSSPATETGTAVAQPAPTLVDTEPETPTLVDAAHQPDPEPAAVKTVAETAVPEVDPAPAVESTPAPAVGNETAAPPPQPEIEALQTAVEPFAVERPENLPTFFDRDYTPRRSASPGIALGDLVRLLDNEKVTVKGSLSLNVEIEFGD